MEDWLGRALVMFPEFVADFEMADLSPTGIWVELSQALAAAYHEEPINEDLIRRIYEYAAWCLAQPQTDSAQTDVSGAVAIGLIEDIPLYPEAKDDLYRWMSVESFDGCESIFRYHLSDDEFQKFRADFMSKKKTFMGQAVL